MILDESCVVSATSIPESEPKIIVTPDYVPIEFDCPLWHMARPLIQNYVPERLQFVANERECMAQIDYKFAQCLYDSAPLENKATFHARLQHLSTILPHAIDLTSFNEEFVGKAMTIHSIDRMNVMLWNQNRARMTRGLPSFEGIIHHILGSMPWTEYDSTRRW